jgi:hypothetical protein
MLSVQVFGPGGTRSEFRSRIFWIDGRRTRAAAKAPQRKRPCRSRATALNPSCSSFPLRFYGAHRSHIGCWEGKHRVFGDVTQQGSFTQLGNGNDLGFRLNGFPSCPSSLSFGPSGTAHVTRDRTSAFAGRALTQAGIFCNTLKKKSIFVIAITPQTQRRALVSARMFGGR